MFEQLEPRHLMAGNVLVEINAAGELIVTGDGFDNRIDFANVPGPSANIEGRNDANGIPTSINGVPNGSFVHGEDVTGAVLITMGDGDDTVVLAHNFPGAFTVRGEGGADDINVGPFGFSTGGVMVVEGGAGGDEIRFQARSFRVGSGPGLQASSLIIRGGDGNDVIQLDEMRPTHDLVVEGGAGADSINMLFARVGGFLGIDGGADYDEISITQVNSTVASLRAGTGTAAVRLSRCEFSGDFAVFTDEGADFVNILNTRVHGTSYIITAGGSDYVLVEGSRFAQLQWNTGAGFDFVDFRVSIADEIFATLSEDADWLRFNYSVVNRGSVIGGNGFDLLTLEGSMLGTLGTDFEAVN
jgi:hypothetical protein